MKKASQILFLVGGILAILLAVLWLVLSIVYFVNAAAALTLAEGYSGADLPQPVKDFITQWAQDNHCSSWKEVATQITGFAVWFLIMCIFSIPAAILSFICKKEKRGLPLLIVATVVNAVGGCVVSVVGGVLGIISWAIWERKEQ